jgi:hypothetical protein
MDITDSAVACLSVIWIRPMAIPTETIMLVPMACTMRKTMSHPKLGDSGANNEATKDTKSPVRNIFLRPNKSLAARYPIVNKQN